MDVKGMMKSAKGAILTKAGLMILEWVLTPENMVNTADTLLDFIEDRTDNKVVIEGLKKLRETFNIPDNDEPEDEKPS